MSENINSASIDMSKPVVPSTRDENLDVMSLLKSRQVEDEVSSKPKSAIEIAKEEKEKSTKGVVVDTAELIEKSSPKKLEKSKSESDAMKEADAYMDEMDRMIEATKKVAITNVPQNPVEMVALMDTLEKVSKEGSIEKSPENGEKTYLRMKTEEEMGKNPDSAITDESTQESQEKKDEVDEEKRKLVNVLIDKTGFGAEVMFTDEEKEKLQSSTLIQVKEVEELELSSLVVKRPEKSFVEQVNEYQFSSSHTQIAFPASRFCANMAGLTYGEMGDIALNPEDLKFEQIRKKLTVIYNKMHNPSCGKFESFDDFLKKFAYVDLDLAIFGLVVSTFPETDDISLNCNNKNCGKSFTHKFNPRSLIRYDKCDTKFLTDIENIIHAKSTELEHLVEESPTRKYKIIKLPYSGFVIKLGIASSYDYLYSIVDNMLGNKFEEEHPDDVNGILHLNSALISLIRAVLVPQNDGSYIEYEDFEDMIHALYMIKPEEIKILTNLLQKFTSIYNVPFELRNIVCPHCGTKTASIPIDINYLVFLKYQRLMSEEINVDNITVL